MDIKTKINEIVGPPPYYCWSEDCGTTIDVELKVIDYDEVSIEVAPICGRCYDLMNRHGRA